MCGVDLMDGWVRGLDWMVDRCVELKVGYRRRRCMGGCWSEVRAQLVRESEGRKGEEKKRLMRHKMQGV